MGIVKRTALAVCLLIVLAQRPTAWKHQPVLHASPVEAPAEPAMAPVETVPEDVDRGLRLMSEGKRDDARAQLVKAFPAHLRDPWAGRIRFVLGYMDIEDKHFDTALSHLRDPMILKSGLDGVSVLYQGHAYFNLKQYERAVEAFEYYVAGHQRSAFRAEALKMLGESLAELKLPVQAAKAFSMAASETRGWEVPSLFFKTADNHEKAGAYREALDVFEHLASHYPTYYRDNEVLTRIKALRGRLKLSSASTADWLRERARSFAEAGYHKSASTEYTRLKGASQTYFTENNLALEAGIAARRAESTTTARALLTEAAARDTTGRAQLELGELAQATGKDPAQMLEAASKGAPDVAELALYRLFMLRHGRGESGAALHLAELVQRFPGKLAGSAVWKRAWWMYSRGAFADASAMFAKYPEASRDGEETAGALYWAARSAERAGKAADAAAFVATLRARFPRTVYAYVSAGANSKAGPPDPPMTDTAAERAEYFRAAKAALPLDAQPAWDRAELLGMCRLSALAIRELSFLESTVSDAGPLRVKKAVIYSQQNAHRQAIVTLRDALPDYLSRQPADLPRFIWEVFYPLRYLDLFREQAGKHGIRTSLLLGLACQESCFNPVARSSSGAMGVMQLIPSTARYVARKHHLSYSSAGLIDPRSNIQMGTLYLDGLLQMFGNNEVYALIGYNAGPGRVTSWKRMMPSLADLELAENALFAETRHYALVVLQNAYEYRRIYGID